MIPVEVNGHTYKSISAAWRELSPEGLPMITVRWRLRNGWPTKYAFTDGPIVPVMRRKGWKAVGGAM